MRNTKRLAFLGGILLIVGLAGMFFTYSSAFETDPITKEKSVDGKFTSLDVQTDDATVKIVPTDENTSKVLLEGKQYKHRNHTFSVDIDNKTLVVKLNDQQSKLFNIDFFSPSITLTVYVPQQQYESLLVSSNNGKINVNHLQAREIHVATSNGRLQLSDLTGSALTAETDNGRIHGEQLQMDKVDMQSDNGRVELQQVTGSSVKARTSNGKLILEEVDGEINGKTNNGAISLVTNHLDQAIELTSDNGRIDVQTKTKPTNTTIIANTDNGKVNVFGKYNGSTVIGDGDHVVTLTTDNGGITVTSNK
ncbi:DUF4097 family beta strand repeat-containing protein [Lentibacillus sp. N15]|uniref:DUF4097 family beta strand repeat-containing protein n=1 Tax=Lentibacillus songyuanensis TaxID=3136161 RepID=UPI0031BAD259